MNRIACSPNAVPLDLRTAAASSDRGTASSDRGTAAQTFKMRHRQPSHYLGNDEPSLDELLADEVLRRVMARDGVQPDHLRALADHVRN